MATIKTPAKTTRKAVAASEPAAEYRMPREVSEWISYAESRLKYFAAKVAGLKAENDLLRKANRVMETRVLGQSQE